MRSWASVAGKQGGPMRRGMIVVLAVAMMAAWAVAERQSGQPAEAPDAGAAEAAKETAGDRRARDWPAFLPAEAHETLRRIETGGPFEHRQDGGTFQNRERLLPQQPRGYYREYTVETPGSRDRGARRIVSGGDPPVERSEEHTSELQSLMRISYAVFCLKKKQKIQRHTKYRYVNDIRI